MHIATEDSVDAPALLSLVNILYLVGGSDGHYNGENE